MRCKECLYRYANLNCQTCRELTCDYCSVQICNTHQKIVNDLSSKEKCPKNCFKISLYCKICGNKHLDNHKRTAAAKIIQRAWHKRGFDLI